MCAGCHADGGNDLMPSKPIKGASFGRQYADDSKLEKTIRKGFPASGMPEFGAERINQAEMKNLILYIRSFTRKSE
jgi:mono/diheme cytochrome c family protein